VAAAVGLAALAAAGCAPGADDARSSADVKSTPSATPSAEATSAPPAACSEDGTRYYQPALLDAQAIWPEVRASETAMRIFELDAAACAAEAAAEDETATAPAADSCRPTKFPWVADEDFVNHELAAAGVHRWGQITIEVRENLVWETVLAPTDKDPDALTDAYRKQLLDCQAQVLANDDGKPVRFLLDGALMVSFHDGIIVALLGRGPDWNSDMSQVMRAAEDRGEKFLR
jgi:hypothetical protein